EAPGSQDYQAYEQPYVEPPVEPATPAPQALVEAPAAAAAPDATVKSGVRLRFPPKTAATPAESYQAVPVESQAAGPAYTPDNNAERVLRRQWWKYDLRV